jgi:uncharacterized protein (TIGR03435 family)
MPGRTCPCFNLVLSKSGLKLKKNTSDVKTSLAMKDGRRFWMRAVHAPITDLVDELTNSNHGAGRPVFDQTGLTGFYDFEIEWPPNNLAAGDRDSSAANTMAPSVFAALDRLGLKLEAGTAPVDTVVIERAEKPSPNKLVIQAPTEAVSAS